MLIYPNIVNMMGEMTVDVNAICLDRSQTYILMIEQRQVDFFRILAILRGLSLKQSDHTSSRSISEKNSLGYCSKWKC